MPAEANDPPSPQSLHADQVAFWQGEGGEHWQKAEARTEQAIATLGARALAAAAAQPGERVLDIGCGTGGTSLALARAVAPGGSVLGLDLSPSMVAEASRRAAAAGLANVRFAACDAATYAYPPAEADLLFSRFGVMFFGDPAAAFTRLRGALKPGGRLAFLCWRPFPENRWAFVPFMAAVPLLPPIPRPGPEDPGPFAFADCERVQRILANAGFADIAFTPVDDDVTLAHSLDEAVAYLTEMGPLSRALRQVTDDACRARVADAVRTALQPHQTAHGVRLGAACWLVHAINPR